jgi:hypothetical protein
MELVFQSCYLTSDKGVNGCVTERIELVIIYRMWVSYDFFLPAILLLLSMKKTDLNKTFRFFQHLS